MNEYTETWKGATNLTSVLSPSWWNAVYVIVHSLVSKGSSRTAVLKAIKRLVPTLTVGNVNAGSLTLRHSSR